MKTMSIHEAKAKLSGLIQMVEETGQPVVLSRYGKPVAEIIPARKRSRTQVNPKLAKVRIQKDLTLPTTTEWDNA